MHVLLTPCMSAMHQLEAQLFETDHAYIHNAVELEDLETASHYVKYAVASYAIQPVSENADKRFVILLFLLFLRCQGLLSLVQC